MRNEVKQVLSGLESVGYVANQSIATAVHLALRLEKPLLVEGAAGVGKTEIAKAVSQWLGAALTRLQCYEGLDLATAAYEWNYQKQLLHIRLESERGSIDEIRKTIFGDEFLLERPLLRSLRNDERTVLLIDEIDRSDEEFEAFLLELLSDFQISIPELGTIRARQRPIVVLTTNGTRELSEALRRRCLYLWLEYPGPRRELKILQQRQPSLDSATAGAAVDLVQALRKEPLAKPPGVAETIDFASALDVLGITEFEADEVAGALGALVKDPQDLRALNADRLADLLAQTRDPVHRPRTTATPSSK